MDSRLADKRIGGGRRFLRTLDSVIIVVVWRMVAHFVLGGIQFESDLVDDGLHDDGDSSSRAAYGYSRWNVYAHGRPGALRGGWAKGGFAYPFDSEFYLCFYFVLSAIDMELADYVLRQLGFHPRSWTNG